MHLWPHRSSEIVGNGRVLLPVVLLELFQRVAVRRPVSCSFSRMTACAVVPDPEKKSTTTADDRLGLADEKEAQSVFNGVEGLGKLGTCAPDSTSVSPRGAMNLTLSPTEIGRPTSAKARSPTD